MLKLREDSILRNPPVTLTRTGGAHQRHNRSKVISIGLLLAGLHSEPQL